MQSLLDEAAEAGEVRKGIDAYELLRGVSSLRVPEVSVGFSKRMVDLLIDGLRDSARRGPR